MCGIGAILRIGDAPIPDAWVDAIDARIAYRGPDGAGRFRATTTRPDGRTVHVALVHRRLSIIDHAGGAQPMTWPPRADDPDVAVVFNGCIYNHRALRTELESLGYAFTSDHSDTEVLVHGHRAWGDELAARLEGMYAYAIWSRTEGTLSFARDWFGEKPLYVTRFAGDDGEVVAAASEARAVARVRTFAGGRCAPSVDWLRGYLRFGYGFGGTTPYGDDVATLPIGLPARLTEPISTDPKLTDPTLPAATMSADPSEDDVETALAAAVASRLEADVPLGCFLSGGVDSSLIAALAVRVKPELHTFCVRMPEPRYDESVHAERVAATLGTTHETLPCDARPGEDLVELVERLGQPFGDSSILPTYWVSRAARRHVKVALSGDGGDELFYGYARYFAAPAIARWHGLLRLLPPRLGAGAHPKSFVHRVGRVGRMARDWSQVGVLALETLFTTGEIDALAGPGADPPIGAIDADGAMATLRRHDLRAYLPGDLLTKVDTASMTCALEVRAPMLDRVLVEHAMPARPRTRKALLRALARRHVPADVVDRPKMGFAVPIGAWFRDRTHPLRGLLDDAFDSASPFSSLPIDVDVARRLRSDHTSGKADHGHRLFTLLTLALWAKQRDSE